MNKPLQCHIVLALLGCVLPFGMSTLCQRIGVVEKTNYPPLENGRPNKYFFVLRDLFEKKNSAWFSVDNWNREADTLIKSKTQYLFHFENKVIPIIGVKNKNEDLFPEQFRINRFPKIKLNKLPKSITEGFENNDIVANLIVSDKKIKNLNIRFLNVELISNNEKTIVYDSIMSQFQQCYGGFEDTSSSLWVKGSHIENELKVLPQNIRLGRVNIPAGNSCFNGGASSYGGGVLHFIIYPNKEVKLLITNTELIEVADYDNDGSLEYIFMKSWFNNYGYIMYFNNFNEFAVNTWSYH